MSGWSLADLLPGLFFLLLALGLAAALRRWYDPLPPRVLGLFLLLVCLLFASSLFGGRILLPLGGLTRAAPYTDLPPPPPGNGLQGDLLHQIVPWQLEVRRAIFDGRWPLWNAHAGAGMPLLGDPQSQAFQPLVAVAWLLPVCNAAALTSALRVFCALAFMFLFLRCQTLGEPAALCGALAYGLGGFLMLWLGWPIGNAAALLPGLLYAVAALTPDPHPLAPSPTRTPATRERGNHPPSWLSGLWAAAPLSRAGVSAGGRGDGGEGPAAAGGSSRAPVLLFLLTTVVLLGGHPETVLYALACAGLFLCARVLAHPAWRDRGALLLRAGSAMALAGLAAAPVLLPASGYIPQTQRSAVIGAHLTSRPLPELAADLGRPEVLAGWAEDALRRVLPVAAPRAFGDMESGYWGSANFVEDTGGCAGAAALLAALLALMPLRGGTERRFPQERLAIALLLVCLALIAQPPGFDSLFFRLPVIGATAIHRHHRTLMLVSLAVAWLAACGVERWQRGAVRRVTVLAAAALLAGLITWAYLAHPSPESGYVVTGLLSGGLAAQLLAVGLAAGLLLIRPGTQWVLTAMAAVIAAELFLLHHNVNSVSPAVFAYPPEPSLAFLQKNLGPYRMVALGESLPANVPSFYGLRDVRIDNPSLPTGYARLVEPLDRFPMAPRFGRPLHPLYDLLAVRYVLVRAGVPVRLPLVYRDPAVWIYQRPQALPLLFLPARARMQRREPWLAWVQGNTDFAARALVAPSAERWQDWRSQPDGSTAALTAFGPALLHAHASFAAPRLLASSIYQDGGWHLLESSADGATRVPTTFTNGPFLAAWLPAGEHELRFIYRPPRFVAGCLLAALALAAACALWVPVPPGPLPPDS